MENLNNSANSAPVRYRPKLRFYHANAKGTGSAAQFELHPAHDDTDGSIMLTVANQCGVGNTRGPQPTFPRFDWKQAIPVKLDFNDLCKMLQVFRGETESIADGHGLYHISSQAQTKIQLTHKLDPTGYALEIYRVPKSGENESRAYMRFSAEEALGLCEAIAGSLAVISFGIPVVLPRSGATSATERRESNDAAA